VIDWLLDADPALRWQVLRDLANASVEEVEAERAKVATEGWGAQLLALQGDDGLWDGGVYRPGWADEDRPFFDAWTATHFSLQALCDFGIDPGTPDVLRAVGRVKAMAWWNGPSHGYFDGETEPCINGIVLANGSYFGQPGEAVVERLLATRLADGGWNCWAEYGATVSSVHSTLCALGGLLSWERATGEVPAEVTQVRRTGEEYLLQRKLFHRLSDGTVIDPRFAMLSYPRRWYYDVLGALEYFRRAGRPDPRCAAAIDLIASKRDESGRWPLENVHQGPTWFEMESPEGYPSRWITLQAARVLRWWEEG
jgi:hypothetical protein